ncbi:hypothetical protein CANARDRAFT_202123 [[Candida] arabinofermentans NRRL YB-2248]|uniref:6-phosphofructo-2-kinase domain-containing protein n=1 Tax=[Candida] arabinofermentans NRRL YB-2248 TaxID=983967 RepID=A0A1E4SWK3_9ASCO|nr:hypothetical protein CANARDRAFT_202123 [[Candida] arabinofermentans NRRL YB-2248]
MAAQVNNDIAEIEEPKIPGNYSARKQNRWIPATIQLSSNEDLTSSQELLVAPRSPVLNNRVSTASSHHHEDVDEIHKRISKFHVSPAQLYSTDSGKLYHAGSICIVLVGQPARGKTNLSISLCRYLRWLGVRANLFHMGDYRREKTNGLPHEFFDPKPESEEAAKARQELTNMVINDMVTFFQNDMGQIAIYDAVNGISSQRLALAKTLNDKQIKAVFIESLIDDEELLERNIADAAKSPDYLNWEENEAIADYKKRIEMVNRAYEEMNEDELTYIKFINFGERLFINNSKHDFLTTKVISYLMNSKIKSGSIYFARCSNNKLKFKSDPPIDDKGKKYATDLSATLLNHFESMGQSSFPKNMVVWTSARLRTTQLADVFKKHGLRVRHRPEMTQMNPGDAEGLSDDELQAKYPVDYANHNLDPYHHRYPRADSYHDIALKLEPLIMEMERMRNDILIIADETILRVFYGYLMASSCTDIPFISFPQEEIIKITYNAYMNKAFRIPIKDSDKS